MDTANTPAKLLYAKNKEKENRDLGRKKYWISKIVDDKFVVVVVDVVVKREPNFELFLVTKCERQNAFI